MSNFKPARFSDFSWGINLRNSADRIDDNQFQELVNMSSEGNKLVIVKWFKFLKQLTWDNTTWKIQWMKLFSNYLICVFKANLYVYNLNTWVVTIQTSAVTSQTDRFQIVINKLADIAIILINTNPSTTEDIKAYEFNITTLAFVSKTFSWLSDKNFKCGAFYEGKLLIWGNPSAPSVLYFSKTFWATSLANIYDFSAYNASSQVVGDGEAIVSFASNNTEFFILKTNSIWKIVQSVDTWSSYAYQLRQETSTWIVNPFCIVNVEKDIIYFDGTTIRRISYEANIQALSDSAIGKDIENWIKALTQSQRDNAFMVYAYPYVKLYMKSNTSSVNDFAILYNIVDKGFSTQTWIEWNIWTNWIYNNVRVAYVGSQFDSTIIEDNKELTYSWWDIGFSSRSKRINFWDWVNYKLYNRIEFNWIITINLNASITIYVDWKEIITKPINSSPSSNLSPTIGATPFGSTPMGSNNNTNESTTTNFETKIELYNSWREIEYVISWSGQWILELNWLAIDYKHTKAYEWH